MAAAWEGLTGLAEARRGRGAEAGAGAEAEGRTRGDGGGAGIYSGGRREEGAHVGGGWWWVLLVGWDGVGASADEVFDGMRGRRLVWSEGVGVGARRGLLGRVLGLGWVLWAGI